MVKRPGLLLRRGRLNIVRPGVYAIWRILWCEKFLQHLDCPADAQQRGAQLSQPVLEIGLHLLAGLQFGAKRFEALRDLFSHNRDCRLLSQVTPL